MKKRLEEKLTFFAELAALALINVDRLVAPRLLATYVIDAVLILLVPRIDAPVVSEVLPADMTNAPLAPVDSHLEAGLL